ncbi:hypothetical protein [Reichenbachiella sp. MALMAid0571]|uniref:hypothetical protein n=1 Tax=Reichenbachiella sp. MALMAid0571 TaxID=3143939 RepID=UPI0032DF0036
MKFQISRGKFIKISSVAMAGAIMSDLAIAGSTVFNDKTKIDDQLMKKLILHNDIRVKRILDEEQVKDENYQSSFRRLAVIVSCVSGSLCNSDSEYYKSQKLINILEKVLDIMLSAQYSDGTLDSGGNRQSPPDTGFILEHLCSASVVLNRLEFQNLLQTKNKLEKFIKNAAVAMVTGGVHTPNHRWVICSALAQINELYPDTKYVERIDEWLAEGIYINEDGHFPERSGNYSAVIDRTLMTMSRLLNRPELLDPVRKNLTTYYFYTEPNGDLVSIDSRRQDQWYTSTITKFYLQYRQLAINDNDGMFASIAKTIESLPDFENEILSNSLIYFMENPDLQKTLPPLVKAPDDFEKFFKLANLARIRHGSTSVTIFGGNDKPVIVSSGRSSNPDFLTFRKGMSMLKYMRLSTSFFRMGYFRGDGLSNEGQKYTLTETKEAYYYQPMSKELRKTDGDYELSQSIDRRFWNKMDFDSREKSNIKKLDTIIEITEKDGTLNLDFKVDGPPNVAVTIEMCFNEGGKLVNTEKHGEDNYLLKSGFGEYIVGDDKITFGPGKNEHQRITRLESEQYSYHQGSLRTEGVHVYLTGHTPFRHKMTIG